ncbi:Lysosomal Pro-Xaa carboxypeptidase [Bertholletia excelsa]
MWAGPQAKLTRDWAQTGPVQPKPSSPGRTQPGPTRLNPDSHPDSSLSPGTRTPIPSGSATDPEPPNRKEKQQNLTYLDPPRPEKLPTKPTSKLGCFNRNKIDLTGLKPDFELRRSAIPGEQKTPNPPQPLLVSQNQQRDSSHHFSMKSSKWLPFALLVFLLNSSFASPYESIPALGAVRRRTPREPSVSKSESAAPEHFKTFFYTQTLDHFNYAPGSYATFEQRYLMNSEYWGGADAKAPIFVYLGAEASIDDDLEVVGFLSENAPRFKALLVFIEHRYYGKSIPFGTMAEAMKNETTRGYFNSAQAIADYAEVILYLKKKLFAHDSPVIVVGGSYGGSKSSLFFINNERNCSRSCPRRQFCTIWNGNSIELPPRALFCVLLENECLLHGFGSSILFFDNITPQDGYFAIVSQAFKEARLIASKPNGLSTLSRKFKTCSRLNSSTGLKDYLETMYAMAAQYNFPPLKPSINLVCDAIDGGSQGTDVLSRVFASLVAYSGNKTCYNLSFEELGYTGETVTGWGWQTCSEMVMPTMGHGSNTMFLPKPFNLSAFINDCKHIYGVTPRPHWITTYYGGHDVKLVLQRFASNIIFSNGLKDPYSIGGVLENLSDSLLAINTVNGTHCLDILASSSGDPQWLIMQRKEEVKIIGGWLKEYYKDLQALKL